MPSATDALPTEELAIRGHQGVRRVSATDVLEEVVAGTKEVALQGDRLDAALEYMRIVKEVERDLDEAVTRARERLDMLEMGASREFFAKIATPTWKPEQLVEGDERVPGAQTTNAYGEPIKSPACLTEDSCCFGAFPGDPRPPPVSSSVYAFDHTVSVSVDVLADAREKEREAKIDIPVHYMFDAIDGTKLLAGVQREVDLVAKDLADRFSKLTKTLDADLRDAKARVVRSMIPPVKA